MTKATIERALGADWLVPVLDDHNRDHFTRGVLVVQACRDCGKAQQPPEDICRSCRGRDLAPRECRGEGTVESKAIVRHAVHPALASRVPYVVVLVSLPDAPGVRLVGNLVGEHAERVAIGAKVRVVFERTVESDSGQSLLIPQWQLAD